MSELTAILCFVVGIVYATPGALPVAGDAFARYGRIVCGLGLLYSSAMLWHIQFDYWGLLTVAFGLGITAVAIVRQACR